jgi:hypothetical protein
MQPRSDAGPIARHVAKRGYGFHHLGFQTTDARAILQSAEGWEICPSTSRNLARGGPAWILRRDLGLLLELCPVGRLQVPEGPDVFRQVCIEGAVPLLANLPQVRLAPGNRGVTDVKLEVNGRVLRLP